MSNGFVVYRGTVMTMVPGEEPIPHGAVGVRDDTIVVVGGESEVLAALPHAPRFDAGGGLILPGFVNTHTHLAMTLLRGFADDLPLQEWLESYIWPAERRFMDEVTVALGTRLAAAECLRAGVTTVCDMYFFGARVAQVLAEVGLRAVVSEGLLDYPTPAAPSPAEGLRLTRELLQEFQGHPLIRPAVAPHAPYSVSAGVLVQAAELAEAFDAPLMIHVAETRPEVDRLLADKGLTPPAYLADLGILGERTIAAHCVHISPADVELLREFDVGVATNPVSNLKLASGVAPLPQLLEAGLKVGFGTDGTASNNTLDLLRDAQLASLLYKGLTGNPRLLPARQLAELLTVGGARVLGLADRIGTLAVGKEADLVVIRVDVPHATPLGDPFAHLAYAARAADVRHVWVRGRHLLADGNLTTIDLAGLLAQARHAAATLPRSAAPR